MTQYTLKLDPVTRDLVFDADGLLETIEGDEATAQNVDNTLRTWKGEFLLEESHGTDYDRILGKDSYDILSNGDADAVLREGILQETRVAVIRSLELAVTDRVLTGTFHGELEDGSPIDMEVLKDV